jgi:hypothetical protein
MVEQYVEVNVPSDCELAGIILIFTGTYPTFIATIHTVWTDEVAEIRRLLNGTVW